MNIDLSYREIAERFGVQHCRGITSTGHYCNLDHQMAGTWEPGMVHFADRRITRVDLFAFLRLVAQARRPEVNDMGTWQRVYVYDSDVRQMAAALKVRFPRRFFAFDRAYVLANVAGMPNSVPLRKQAFDWARR